jgi:hypothetical protein
MEPEIHEKCTREAFTHVFMLLGHPPGEATIQKRNIILFIFMLHTQVHYIGGTIVIAITTL